MTIKTKCVRCGRTYINYNDLCTACRGAKQNDSPLHIDDAIDLDRDQQDISEEIEAQRLKDYGPRP